ncbi:MAG TPA: anthranilate synthase component I [Thiobacillaceae bacterium]|nr:anthranilate synthase component I [Thiobacillaceae bacterium]HNU64674.1 anthranilate synthase component I [Thiobacillaceae bacterium]
MFNEDKFNSLARQGYNRIPVIRQLPADLDTPLSLYLKLANQPYTYLLESVEGGERFGRYSFIGLPARTVLRVYGHFASVETKGLPVEQCDCEDPLAFIESFQARFKAAPVPGMPRFPGGLCGYFGYDTVRYIEKRLARTFKPDDVNTPDILLMLTDELAVVDNLTGGISLIVYADPLEDDAYLKAHMRLNDLARELEKPVKPPIDEAGEEHEARSEFGENGYKAAVERAKRYITAGDIMQVVLAQRMSRPFHAHPLSLYRALRRLNPSPYMFYYDMGGFQVVGSSPEILVRLEGQGEGVDKRVTVRPIAGTRPRGANREEDLSLEQDLLTDPKELAEHVQLMDLGRNDVGRVARVGSVQVTENMRIERYSHVMHIVSNVEARLRPNLSAMDVLRATFPAGTVSGAPKIRAMEIIDELEPSKRGIYAGAVGYLGFNGDMDLAIAIRTAVVKNGTLYVQAGAGIVADSVPENEWQETRNKARAVIRAAELALYKPPGNQI